MQGTSDRTVSIIIVTLKVRDYLRLCLDSLKHQTHRNLEIIVIDNSLDPNFTKELCKDYTNIKLYSGPRNLFYGAALNKGIEMSQGDFVLCLNDDVTLDKRFIEEALRGFFLDAKIGMISGKILRQDGITIDSTGLFLSPWRTAKERSYGLKDRGDYEKEEYIFAVSGAVAFYRKEMLENIKLDLDYFDVDYRMFYEDLDIAWRGQNFGWKAYYTPRAVAYHIRGGTARGGFGIDKPYARRYLSDSLYLDLIKNRYLVLIKNEPLSDFLLHLPFILFYDIVVWIYTLFFRPGIIKKFILNLKILQSAFKKKKIKNSPSHLVGG